MPRTDCLNCTTTKSTKKCTSRNCKMIQLCGIIIVSYLLFAVNHCCNIFSFFCQSYRRKRSESSMLLLRFFRFPVVQSQCLRRHCDSVLRAGAAMYATTHKTLALAKYGYSYIRRCTNKQLFRFLPSLLSFIHHICDKFILLFIFIFARIAFCYPIATL